MEKLKQFTNIIGYSGHERGTAISLAAVAMGAKFIERHITLDKNMEGPDHKASLSIDKLSIFIKNLNLIRKSYLKKKRLLTNLEKQTKNKARKSFFISHPFLLFKY